jgi:predicted Zn-dependent peptidase
MRHMFLYRLNCICLIFSFLFLYACSSQPIKPREEENLTEVRATINAQKILEDQSTPQFLSSQGLSIHVKSKPNAHLVSLQLWLSVGTGDEKSDETGVAYVLQSFLTGQPEISGTLSGKIASFGGKVSAWTSIDRTVFEITVLPEHLPKAIQALSEMTADLSIDENAFQLALESLIESQSKAKQWMNKQALERLIYQAFQGHPNGKPSLPYTEDIKKITYQMIKNFHQRLYHPNRAHLVVVGKTKESEITSLVQKHWANWTSKGENKEIKATQLEDQSGASLQIDYLKQSKSQIYVAFPLDQVTPENAAYLDVLSLLLGGDTDRLLYRAARQVGLEFSKLRVFPFIPDGPGLLIIQLEVSNQQVELAWRILMEQLNNLRYRPPMFKDMEQAKMLFERDTIKNGEAFSTQARRIGFFATRWENTAALVRYSRAIYQVRPEDISSFARDLFKLNTLNAFIQTSPSEQISTTDFQSQLQSQAKAILNQESLIKSPGVWQVDQNLKVIFHPVKNEGVIALKAVLPFPAHLHSTYELALAHWVAHLVALPQPYEPEFQSEVHLGALHLKTTITVGELDEAIAAIMRRLRQAPLRTDPAWSSDALERARAFAQAELQLKRHRPLDKLTYLFQRAQLAQKMPAPANFYARTEELESVSASDVINWYKAYIQNKPILLTITGDINRSELGMALTPFLLKKNQADSSFGEMIKKEPVLDLSLMESPTLNQCRYIVETIDHDRSWLQLGFSIEDQQAKDELFFKLIESYFLDTQGSFQQALVAQKITAKMKAVAYQEGDHPFISIYLETEAQFQNEILEAFQASIKAFKSKPIETETLQRIKDQLIARQRIELSTCANQADFLSLLYSQGWQTIGTDAVEQWVKGIKEISASQLYEAVQRLIPQKQEVSAILTTPQDQKPITHCQRLSP